MPRYFFDVHSDGHKYGDDVGTEFTTLEEVRQAAMRVLPAVAHEDIPKDGDKQAFTVLVTDEDGQPVYSATLAYVGLWLLR